MFPYLPVLLALLVASSLAGCRAGPVEPPAAAAGPAAPLAIAASGEVVARVDGVAIDRRWVEALARGRRLDPADPAQQAQLLDELVEYVVLVEAGRRDPALEDAQARIEVELNALSARASAVMARIAAIEDPAESALREEYDNQRRINGSQEYQVSHLLFADEAVAREAATALAAGQSFQALGAGFADRIRPPVEIGWLKLGQLPEGLADVLRDLQPGSTSAEPVQTPYGWHLVHLQDVRPFEPPPFEQVREGIRRMLIAQASRARVDALKAAARIELPGH
ncbi:MAG: peptidyl-prolyl cis-trans isomerase [Xanthomonadales bacterium]|nr:peptidyl-prolyl cis-trans isomerase [Xanthomonadales bacterium]